MSLKKATKYISDKIESLFVAYREFRVKMKAYCEKWEKDKKLKTGLNEGKCNFYQKMIGNCEVKMEKIRSISKKIDHKYALEKKEKEKIKKLDIKYKKRKTN